MLVVNKMSTDEETSNGTASAGPTRAKRSNKVERPPTAFALAPVNLSEMVAPISTSGSFDNNDFEDTNNDVQQEDTDDSTNEVEKEEKDEGGEEEDNSQQSGPTRSTASVNRPPTTFVSTPIKPNQNPSLKSPNAAGSPTRRAAPVKRPGTTFVAPGTTPSANPSLVTSEVALLKQEKIDAAKSSQNLRVNTNELLQYATAEEIWAKSSAVGTLKNKIDNVHVLEQLFVCIVEPKRCT